MAIRWPWSARATTESPDLHLPVEPTDGIAEPAMRVGHESDRAPSDTGGVGAPLPNNLDVVVCAGVERRVRESVVETGDIQYRAQLLRALSDRSAAEVDSAAEVPVGVAASTDALARVELDRAHVDVVLLERRRERAMQAQREHAEAAAQLAPALHGAWVWGAALLVAAVGVGATLGGAALLTDALDTIYLRGSARAVIKNSMAAARMAQSEASMVARHVLGALGIGLPLLAVLLGVTRSPKRTLTLLAVGADVAIVLAVAFARSRLSDPGFAAPAGLLEFGIVLLTNAAAFAGYAIADAWRTRADVLRAHASGEHALRAAVASIEGDLALARGRFEKQATSLQIREEAAFRNAAREAAARRTAEAAYALAVLENQSRWAATSLTETLQAVDGAAPLGAFAAGTADYGASS